VRLPPSTAKEIERLVDEGRYPNRSTAIRAGVRLLIEHESSRSDGPAGTGNSESGGCDDRGTDGAGGR
jgi:Arc/MetJ-type ribon-helix-helix transcriptional regulator